MTVPSQAAWVQGDFPAGQTDSEFAKEISDTELEAIAVAVEQVSKARALQPEKKALVFFGVGVGNPAFAWGNPSGQMKVDKSDQISPPLLKDAVEKGFFVIGLNFNVDSTGAPGAIAEEKGIHLHVAARFPLAKMGTLSNKAFTLLQQLAATSNRLVVLNCVSQIAYPTLIELASMRTGMRLVQSEDNVIPSVYALSYGQTGTQTVTVRLPMPASVKTNNAVVKNTGLTTMDEVFPKVEDVLK